MLHQSILDNFARIPPHTTLKNRYYGVYNKILDRECFPEDKYTVEPQYPLPPSRRDRVPAGVITYVVGVDQGPVFFAEITPPGCLASAAGPIAADGEMRDRLRALCGLTPLPRLHGISVVGQRIAFYCVDKATGSVDPEIEATVPAERWGTDITTEEGHRRFMAVVVAVRQMAAAL